MNIVLPVDGPLDARATLARYRLWGEDPANRVVGEAFVRVLRLDGRLVPYQVRWEGMVDDCRLRVRVPGRPSARVAEAVSADVQAVFGLDFDVPGFYRLAKGDPVLAALVERFHGLRPTLTPGGLEMLVGAIIAQQINLAFAFAVRARLVRRYGTPLGIAGETVWAFPEAATLARAGLRDLRAMKFSTRKAQYIQELARTVAAGALDFTALAALGNEAVAERLTAHRGLGRWTADWFLARCFGRPDVCPAGDLAVRKAFAHYYGGGRELTEAAIRRRARAFGPFQTVAIHYLLAGLRLTAARSGGGT